MSGDDDIVWRALRFAARQHAQQKRKDTTHSPYINHVIDVMATLAEHDVTDTATLAAAALHDTVEDTGTSPEEIENSFGQEVRSLVAEMTDDKSLEKQRRKALQIEHARGASSKAKQIKIADKICNVADVGQRPATGWSVQRRLEYVDWADAVMAGLRGQNPALEATYDAVAKQTRQLLEAPREEPAVSV